MHALVCMILLFFPSVSIYLLLEYSLYIAPYNLLCPSEYGGITEYAFEFVSTGLAASILAFLEYWLLPCEQAQDILFDLRYSEASEIMKRWREGPSYLSNYSNSNQTHDWAGIPPTDCKCMNGPSRHHVMQKNFPYELSQRPMGIMEWVSTHCLMS